MSLVLFLGLVLAVLVVLDLLVIAFGEESRPEFGGGHPILMA
jgi:hypothetical protein